MLLSRLVCVLCPSSCSLSRRVSQVSALGPLEAQRPLRVWVTSGDLGAHSVLNIYAGWGIGTFVVLRSRGRCGPACAQGRPFHSQLPARWERGGRASETRRTFPGRPAGLWAQPPLSPPTPHLPQASCWFWGWAPAPVDVGFAVPSGEVSGFGSPQPLPAGASGRRGPGRGWSAFQTHTGLLKRASLFTGSRPWGCISLSFVTCLLRLLDFRRNKIWASRSPLPPGGPAGVLDVRAKSPFPEGPVFLSR